MGKGKKEMLLDSFSKSGNSVEEFKRTITELSDMTSVLRVNMSDVLLCSKNDFVEDKEEGKTNVFLINPKNIWDETTTKSGTTFSLNSAFLRHDSFKKADAMDFLDEFTKKNKLILKINGKGYFTSDALPKTLGSRIGLTGISKPCVERDLHIASRLNKNEPIKLVVRYQDNIRKVFATMSNLYAYVPQTFMCDVLDAINTDEKLGKMECTSWFITNEFSEIYLEFPEKAKEISDAYKLTDDLIPGLYLCTSDTGNSSILIRATWRMKNSKLLFGESRRKHMGSVDTSKLLEEVEKVFFAEYVSLPEKLCDLMLQDITDPTWSKIPEKAFIAKNEVAVKGTLKKIFNEIDVVGAIGKKNEKEIFEQLVDENDYVISYTAYDIVKQVMTLPERCSGLTEASKCALGKACAKAPFVDLQKPEPKKVVLT